MDNTSKGSGHDTNHKTNQQKKRKKTKRASRMRLLCTVGKTVALLFLTSIIGML